ncbi:MAG: caspase family protein [Deltaproteobacteria bacterium]|nr:caspase family protein [Deltaproteobacteria bacterium]
MFVQKKSSIILAIVTLLVVGPSLADDQTQRPNAYALIIGSNRGGPGQEDLRYAQQDARRIRDVLTQLGGYSVENTTMILDPGQQQLLDAIAEVKSRLAVHEGSDESSVFLLYYSGHARANALNMGVEELELTRLRSLLESMPATLTIAILDACQTGAISRIKGVEPAADFSFNSVNHLNTAGVVVMASSAASELSQEAESLKSSFFTHHLVVGLRGAADLDSDGRVTLSEAYNYAYNRTLISTASTAIGKQHVTLETELKGKGDMVLTFPARASSVLRLPVQLAGDVLVHGRESQSVVAEMTKVAGQAIRLAIPEGQYRVFVRSEEDVFKCDLDLGQDQTAELVLEECSLAEPGEIGIKGPPEAFRETWGLELSFGVRRGISDNYSTRLRDFGFNEQLFRFNETFSFSLAGMYSFSRYLSLIIGFSSMGGGAYEKEVYDLEDNQRFQTFEWSAYDVGFYVRGTLPLIDGILNPYMQAGGGLSFGTSVFKDPVQASEVVDDQVHWGYHIEVGAGLNVMILDNFGVFGQLNYTHAPVIGNNLGDIHDSGGLSGMIGIRGAL